MHIMASEAGLPPRLKEAFVPTQKLLYAKGKVTKGSEVAVIIPQFIIRPLLKLGIPFILQLLNSDYQKFISRFTDS